MITLIPNSWGSVLLEDNDCHLPAGSSEGGQFCSKGGGWKPSMTRAEADVWAKDSLVQDIGTVVVRDESAPGIRRSGFQLTKRSGGRVWGDAVYVGLEPESESFYRYMKGVDTSTTLEVKVNVRRPLVLRASAKTLSPRDVEAVKRKYPSAPGGVRFAEPYFNRAFPANLGSLLQQHGLLQAYHARADDTADKLKQLGYDSIVILSTPDVLTSGEDVLDEWARVGYAQVVVFDPKNVTIVGERPWPPPKGTTIFQKRP